MGSPSRLVRADLTADALFPLVRATFDAIPETRTGPSTIPRGDALLSAFAMFSLKDPSLLAFDHRRRDPNDHFRTVYGITRVPSDTQMRDLLDPVDPAALRPAFRDVFRRLQRDHVLDTFGYLGGQYLISVDGTNYFATTSDGIHCPECLVKRNRVGVVTHYHQMLGAAIVHPDHKEVIPLAPEPIVNGDGHRKNDGERNATRRWLRAFRRDHPRLPVLLVEDDLAANAPHLRDVRAARAGYLITVQPGDHKFLFDALFADDAAGRTAILTTVDSDTGIVRHYRSHHGLSLNESNPDTRVSVLEYWEWSAVGDLQVFSWITDQPLTPDTVYDVMRGGRARWTIENETFNTLKNQGYQFEHNYGHGKKHLSVVLAVLMILAFLVDQAQQIGCPAFRAAWAACGTKRSLWDQIRAVFRLFAVTSMGAILRALADRSVCPPLVPHNTG
ncbi:transposase [Fimbriiglobus ruber]|uniref:Transposase IS4-like domain-containing protein n=1 Tax=Fimbriiglobus ruber TaxID=1908690 RepID=A0A225DXP4_9BACT|nr:transposase [Fimbriiglobus ruber]OWK40877.1 hypothetical protein FRUB_04769 [Fimbriiglobus ruber]